jgi:pRiA4b ORF-3-like protein
MPEILTLNIALSGWRAAEHRWSSVIEVSEETTLADLHYIIQELVKFDDDHLHEFYAGQHWRQRKFQFGEASSPFEENEAEDIGLSAVFPLEKKYHLYYHFDFGDDWIFEIKCRLGRKPMAPRAKYPRIVERSGRRPRQY